MPGQDSWQLWDEAKYERNKEQLHKDIPDVLVTEYAQWENETDINDNDSFYVHVPGAPEEETQTWNGAKLKRNREQLLKDVPDIEITRYRQIDYAAEQKAARKARLETLRNGQFGYNATTAEEARRQDEKSKPYTPKEGVPDYSRSMRAAWDMFMEQVLAPKEEKAENIGVEQDAPESVISKEESLRRWNAAKREYDRKAHPEEAAIAEASVLMRQRVDDAEEAGRGQMQYITGYIPAIKQSGKSFAYTVDYLAASSLSDLLKRANGSSADSEAALAELNRRTKAGLSADARTEVHQKRNEYEKFVRQFIETDPDISKQRETYMEKMRKEGIPETELAEMERRWNEREIQKRVDGAFKEQVQLADMEYASKQRAGNSKVRLHATLSRNKEIDDLIDKTLRESGGDVEEARLRLSGRATSPLWYEREIARASEGIEANSMPTKGAAAWLGNMTVLAVPTLAGVAASAYTGNPQIAVWTGKTLGAMFGAQAAGGALYQAKKAGATDSQAWSAAFAGAGIMYLTQQIPFNKFASRMFEGQTGAIASSLAEAIGKKGSPAAVEMENLFKEAQKRLGGSVLSKTNWNGFLPQVASSTASFATMTALEEMVPILYENPQAYPTLTEIFKAGLKGAEDGLVMGVLMGSASALASRNANIRRWEDNGGLYFAEMENPEGGRYFAEILAMNGRKIERPFRETGTSRKYLRDTKGNRVRETETADFFVRKGAPNESQEIVSTENAVELGGTVTLLVDGKVVTIPRQEFLQRVTGIGNINAKSVRGIAEEYAGYEDYQKGYNASSADDRTHIRTEIDKNGGNPPGGGTASGEKSPAVLMREGQRDALRDRMTGEMGQFWQEHQSPVNDADGNPIEVRQVRVLRYADGTERFILSNDGNGNNAYVDGGGKQGFINDADIAAMTGDGRIISDREIMLDDYLEEKLSEQDAIDERERMAAEAADNLAEIQERVQQEGVINIGTPESEVLGKVVDINPAPDGGIAVQVEGEKEPVTLSWPEVASKLGMPLNARSNAELAEASRKADAGAAQLNSTIPEGAELRVPIAEVGGEAVYRFQSAENVNGDVIIKALDEESGDVVELSPDMVSNLDEIVAKNVDEQGNPLDQRNLEGNNNPPVQQGVFDDPVANELGIPSEYAYKTKKGATVVDGGKLWLNDPDLWARWNDRNPNTKVGTLQYLEAKLKEIDKEVETQSALLATEQMGQQRPDVLEELQDKLDAKQGRQAVVKDLRDRYAAEEEARKAAEEAQKKAAEAAEEQKRIEERQRAVEERRKEKEKKELQLQQNISDDEAFKQIQKGFAEAEKVQGDEDTLVFGGQEFTGHYYLTEAEAPTASHKATEGWTPTAGFPKDETGRSLNTRDYEHEPESQRHVQHTAEDYDSRAIQHMVVVTSDGIVISGNERTMASQLAAGQNTDGKYIDYLKKHPGKYGFTEEQVSQFKHPRVIFVPDGALPYTAKLFDLFNKSEEKQQNTIASAVKVGKLTDEDMVMRVADMLRDVDDINKVYQSPGMVNDLLNILEGANIITREARPTYTLPNGALSGAGEDLVEAVLFGTIFSSSDEAIQNAMADRAIRQRVVYAFPTLVRIRNLRGEYSIINEMTDAVALLSKAKAANKGKAEDALGLYMTQYQLFSGELPVEEAAVQMLATVLNDRKVSLLRGVLDDYIGRAEDAAAGQMLLDGTVETKQDILLDLLKQRNVNVNIYGNKRGILEGQEVHNAPGEHGGGGDGAAREGGIPTGGLQEARDNTSTEGSSENRVAGPEPPAGEEPGLFPGDGAFSLLGTTREKAAVDSAQEKLDKLAEKAKRVKTEDGKAALMEEKAGILQEMYDRLGMRANVATRGNIVERYRKYGGSERSVASLEDTLASSERSGHRLRGFYDVGEIFINADDVASAEDGMLTHEHEDQHRFNEESGAWQDFSGWGIPIDELHEALRHLTGSDAYDERGEVYCVDEIIANAREIARSAGEEAIPQALREAGIHNDDFINFVKETVHNGREQTRSERIAHTRRAASEHSHAEGTRRQAGRHEGGRSSEVGRSGHRPVQRDVRRAGAGQEVDSNGALFSVVKGREGAALADAVNKKNLIFKQGKPVDYAYTSAYLYVYYNPAFSGGYAYGNGEINVIQRIPIGNDALINAFTKSIDNGTIRNAGDAHQYLKDVRSRQRHDTWQPSIASEERGRDGETDALDRRPQPELRRNESGGIRGNKQARSASARRTAERAAGGRETAGIGSESSSIQQTSDIKNDEQEGTVLFSIANAFSKSREEFDAMQKLAEQKHGIVATGLYDVAFPIHGVPRHNFTGSGRQAIEKARQWAEGNLVGSHKYHDGQADEFSYEITGGKNGSIGEMLSRLSTTHSDNLGVHLAVLRDLPAVIDASYDVEIHADYTKENGHRTAESKVNPSTLIHRLYGAVNIDSQIYRVKTTIEEHRDKENDAYTYQVTKVELLISGSAASDALSNSTISAANLLKGVEKSYDSGKKMLDAEYLDTVEAGDMAKALHIVSQAAAAAMPKSVVRDENGLLVPVYHDTNSKRYVNRETGQDWEVVDWKERDAWEQRDDWNQYWEERDFYTFDRRNARTSIEMPAFFFAPKMDEYHEYGERTIQAYINLTNPAMNPDIENAGVTDNAGAEAMQSLIDQGYDGFIRTDEDGNVLEYGVFDSAQIKSADAVTKDDNGNVIPLSKRFDLSNSDIRFSITGQKEKKKAPASAVPGDESPFKATDVTSADGANVLNNLESFAKEAENLSFRVKNSFLRKLAENLGAKPDGSNSKYATFEAKNGTIFTLRLADHNAKVSNFDNRDEDYGISLIISRKANEGITNDGTAHVEEFFYSDKSLRKSDSGTYAKIVRSVIQSLYSGAYKDATGLAQHQEVNGEPQSKSGVSFSDRDNEYFSAVQSGNMVKAQELVNKAAAAAGYTGKADYQGSLAFNGAAPSANGYFETREDRKEAFDNGEFEDTYSLGDFMEVGLDNNDLQWQLDNPVAASARDKATLESIRNISNVVKGNKSTIKMYRAVPADIKEGSFRNGDWITPSRQYAEHHIELQDWKGGRIIEQEVSVDDIWWNGDDINEWGFDDGNGYAYKNTENNRKILDPVTYDDNGNVIPLSRRFNESNPDVRFSVTHAVRQEMDRIKAAAQADGTFMKAPNGKATNLSEERWLLVRTPNFKNWFGDWQNEPIKKEAREKLRKSKPVSITGKEIPLSDNPSEQRKHVTGYMKSAGLLGEYTNKDTGTPIRLTRGRNNGGVMELLQHDFKDAEHIQSIAAVPKIIEESIYFGWEYNRDHDRNPGVKEYQNYVCGLKIGGEDYTVLSKIAVDRDGNRYYDHRLTHIEKGKLLEQSTRSTNPASEQGVDSDAQASGYKYRELLSVIQNCSAILDNNGEPLVAWHGSYKKGIRIFGNEHKWSDAPDNSFWFSSKKSNAETYQEDGGDLLPVFLSIKNPLVVEAEGQSWNQLPAEFEVYIDKQNGAELDEVFQTYDEALAFAKGNGGSEKDIIPSGGTDTNEYARRAQEKGYDGLIVRNVVDIYKPVGDDTTFDDETSDVYAVFKPNQIKSADHVTYDESGNVIPLSERFSSENDDINFSVANRNQEVFISNAAKAAQEIKMDKATPEQWIKMLEKGGGLKAGEDKWIGLSDWLKAFDKKTLTKQEVLDYINQNKIRIEEVDYMDAENVPMGDNDEWEQAVSQRYGRDVFDAFRFEPGDGGTALSFIDEDKAAEIYRRFQKDFGYDYQLITPEDGQDYSRTDMLWMRRVAERIADYGDEQMRVKYGKTINPTRLDYTTEGLENKREIALTVPTVEPWNENDNIHFGDAGEGRAIAWVRFGETTTERGNGEAPVDVRYIGAEPADEPHRRAIEGILLNWKDSENVMRNERRENQFTAAKAMFENSLRDNYYEFKDEERILAAQTLGSLDDLKESDFEPVYSRGGRVLVIDEIQSKRHQEGREKGYITTDEVQKDGARIWELMRKYGVSRPVDLEAAITDREDYEELQTIQKKGQIPAAPFEKNWHELAMKRMLRLAAEEGYDYVAWTTGEQQAERYDIGNAVESISATKFGPVYGFSEDTKQVVINFRDSGLSSSTLRVNREGKIVATGGDDMYLDKNLSEVVGKEIAVRLLGDDSASIEGDGLRIGGEGMKGFYDKMLPAFMNKYGKKWGVKVEDITLPGLDYSSRTMHAVPVTQEMRDSVMEGQLMFSLVKDNDLPVKGELPADRNDDGPIRFQSLGGLPTGTGRQSLVERTYRKTGAFSFTGKEKIESAGDVAYIFKELETAAVENSFVVYVKGGVPTILHTGIGNIDSVGVDEAAFAAGLKDFAPDEVYMVHNHPSGRVEASRADISELEVLQRMAGDVPVSGVIIDTLSGEYGLFAHDTFPSTLIDSRGKSNEGNFPLEVQAFDKMVFAPEYKASINESRINGPEDIASYLSAHRLGSGQKVGALLLNRQHNVVGNVVLNDNSISWENAETLARQVVDAAVHSAATSVVLFGDFAYDLKSVALFRSRLHSASGNRVSVLDVVRVEGNHTRSMSEGTLGDSAGERGKNVRLSTVNFGEFSIENLDAKRQNLLATKPLNVVVGTIKAGNGLRPMEAAYKWYDDNIGKPREYDTEVGKVTIDKESIQESLSHKFGQAKLDAVSSLFDGFKVATYLTSTPDFDGKPITDHYFAYPIQYDGATNYVLCRAREDVNKNRLYIHEVFPMDKIKSETIQTLAGQNQPQRGRALYEKLLAAVLYGEDTNNFQTTNTLRDSASDLESRRAAISSVEKDGIGAVIGEENVRELYGDIYRAIPKDVLKPVVEGAIRDGLDIRKHLDAYLHKLAESGPKEDGTGLLLALFDRVRDLSGVPALTDGDIRYMLWKQSGPAAAEEDLLALASSTAMKNRWHAGSEKDAPSYSMKGEFEQATEEARRQADETIKQAGETLKEAKNSLRKELSLVIKAMGAQKTYDRATIDALVKFAKKIMKNGGVDKLTLRETNRLLTLVSKPAGMMDANISRYADNLTDLLLEHIVKDEKQKFSELIKTEGSRVNKNGVEVIGKLDSRGQATLKAFRDNMSADEESLARKLSDAIERMESSDDAVRTRAEAEYTGLMLADSYRREIADVLADEASLEDEIQLAKEAKVAKAISYKVYAEQMKAINQALRESRMELVDLYRDYGARLANIIAGSRGRAADFRQAKKDREMMIHKLALDDLAGIRGSSDAQADGMWAKIQHVPIVGETLRLINSPLATFNELLRLFGRNSIDGSGRLHTYFMEEAIKASEDKYKGVSECNERLDKIAGEIFGGKVQRWTDLYKIANDAETESGKTITVKYKTPQNGEKQIKLGYLGALELYADNKMVDGKMKLRAMGISESDIMSMRDTVASVEPGLIEFVDRVQSEFFPERRNKYNSVHEELFGAPMTAVEDYFPLDINSRERTEVRAASSNETGNQMPDNVTGSIIKRIRNTRPIDIANADVLARIAKHNNDMEEWAAYGHLREDLKSLLSYNTFMNKVMQMSTVYGSGPDLWRTFRRVCAITAEQYNHSRSYADRLAVSVAQGFTSGAISLRLWTAAKQFASIITFFADASPVEMAKSMANWKGSWNWCMDNLPLFEKRWKSRVAGYDILDINESDLTNFITKLRDKVGKYGMLPNAFVDAATIAAGAKAVYETEYKRLLNAGYGDERARERAIFAANQAFNTTQQSSEKMYLSETQAERTFLTSIGTVFRNGPFGFTRRYVAAARELGKLLRPSDRERYTDFEYEKAQADGLSDEDAMEYAEKKYGHALTSALITMGVMGFLAPLFWNIMGNAPYLIFGKDEKKKRRMLKDSSMRALLLGPAEGLLFGAQFTKNAYDMIVEKQSFKSSALTASPLISDMEKIAKKFGKDNIAAIHDLAAFGIKMELGADPQTLTDAIVAIVDACNGDFGTAREAELLMLRIMNVPQSQQDELFIDELGLTAREASGLSKTEIAKRYADYKIRRGSGILTPFYSMEEYNKKRKSYSKRILKKEKERNKENKEK